MIDTMLTDILYLTVRYHVSMTVSNRSLGTGGDWISYEAKVTAEEALRNAFAKVVQQAQALEALQ